MSKPLRNHYKVNRRACLVLMLSLVVALLPGFIADAMATNTPIGEVLCVVVQWFTGNAGKGLATIGVSILGIGALLGKLSWGIGALAAVGVAIIFGAPGIVNAMGTTYANANCTTTSLGAPPPPPSS